MLSLTAPGSAPGLSGRLLGEGSSCWKPGSVGPESEEFVLLSYSAVLIFVLQSGVRGQLTTSGTDRQASEFTIHWIWSTSTFPVLTSTAGVSRERMVSPWPAGAKLFPKIALESCWPRSQPSSVRRIRRRSVKVSRPSVCRKRALPQTSGGQSQLRSPEDWKKAGEPQPEHAN